MATRNLPGVYISLNDMSQFPEGATSLNVGYVLQANRGPVNEFSLVTSPTDFLTKYTFSGAPKVTDDPTFHSILKVLAQTNSMYVVRAANNPLYGGAVVKKAADFGQLTAATITENEGVTTCTLIVSGPDLPAVGESITVEGTVITGVDNVSTIDGYYTVTAVDSENKVLTIKETLQASYTGTTPNATKVFRCPVQPLSTQVIANVVSVTAATKIITLAGLVGNRLAVGSKFEVKGSETAANNGVFTVESVEPDGSGNTNVKVKETVVDAAKRTAMGAAYYNSLESGEGFVLGADDLFLITGIDQGAYNGKLAFNITSSLDNPEDFVYYIGADIGTGTPCTFGTMRLDVINSETNEILETFTFSRDENAKAIDGASLFVDNVVEGSAYIKIFNNTGVDLPNSTLATAPILASGGSDGEPLENMQAALDVFKDKTIPISILGNGCSTLAETQAFQTGLLDLAKERKDLMVFLNSRKSDETATLPSTRVKNIVDYKKKTLGATTFYGCMYAPHVKTPDSFNQRQVAIGSDAVAIAGWLDVINNLNYPYAYAGPQNGLVTGVTCDWKIGDTSGEAEQLNDASINYVAYDGKVGRYYMQTQNTLQIANSAMRNIGAVLNVLDIKENLAVSLKEYLQLPITDSLRAQILDTCNDYLAPMQGVRFYNYSFQDVTSDADLAQDTLRYLGIFSVTRYAQKIYVVMNIVNSTFDFSILQSA